MILWICSFITLFLGYIYVFRLNRKLPDGVKECPIVTGWPILGILPKITKPFCHYLLKISEKHGNLYRIKFGMRDIYVLNNYSIIKKCLKDDGENFTGRWNGKLFELLVKNSGIIFIDGEVWALHRSFMLKILRDFGFGKSRTTEIVQEECLHLLLEIEGTENKALDFSETIPIYTANIISKFIMNKRYERSNKDFQYIAQMVERIAKQNNFVQTFHLLFPFFDRSTFLSRISFYLSSWKDISDHIYGIFRKEINDHLKVLDLNSEGEDLMDRFLIEQAKIIDKTGSVQSFTEFQLIRSSIELLMAGFETTSTTLGWSLLFLARYPEIQMKMHDEIVGIIGLQQIPSPHDKKFLPLTQAIMDEILRLSSVAPLSIFHSNINETVIDGIYFEKRSMIFPNIYACHRDSQVWKKPFEFYPEHFLISDDNGTLKYNPREELIPFGIGKRQCLGESLARAEFFIFLVAIIQKFKVTFSETITEDQYQKALLGVDGTIRYSNIKVFKFEKYQ